MMVQGSAVEDFLTREPEPFAIALAPAAGRLAAPLASDFPRAVKVLELAAGASVAAPGRCVLVLAPGDLNGPHRGALLQVARAALPGRPVLVGGTRSREVLLDAINNWRVFRVVPDMASPAALVDAIRKAFEAMRTEAALERAAAALRLDTSRLQETMGTLATTQSRLIEAERLTTLGRLTGGLIPSVRRHFAALQDFRATMDGSKGDFRIGDRRLRTLLGYAFEGIRSMESMLDEIRAYAEERPSEREGQVEELDELAEFAVSFSKFDTAVAGRDLRTHLVSKARVRVDRHRMYQVLINLLRNAFQATSQGGRINVRTAVEGDQAVIEVADAGTGMTEEVREKAFQPFFTTKGEDGTGLGLWMCRTMVERHGGTITCTSAPGQGTTFRIGLPIAD